MKKLILMVLPVFLALLLISCEDSGTDPIDPGTQKGSILVTSAPVGAAIWIDNAATGKVTPDSVTGLSTGAHNVTLKLTGYRDTTVSVTVTANILTPKHVNLTQNPPDLQSYTGIKLYERQSNSFSGLDLSTGTRGNSTGTETDIYYEGSGILRSQHMRPSAPTNPNETYFNNTSNSNLEDGNDSPIYASGWATETSSSTNYSFLFDMDSHYSKIKITGSGQDGPFDNWITVSYKFNKTANDVRF